MKTEILKIEDIKKDAALVEKAGRTLREGGLVAIPTETVYGLAANALDTDAVKKIFEAKGRPSDNPLIVHVADKSGVEALVRKVDERFYALAEKFWPGPLTVVMKKSDAVPDITSGGLDTVAVRCPSNPVANAIIKAAGVPIAAPSANTSGKPSPTTAQHVADDMSGKIDLIVDGGKCEIGVESTVITLATEPPRLLRPGKVTPEELEEFLPDLVIDSAVFSKVENGEKVQSPGMKYKHYSPEAEVVLLRGTPGNAVKYINKYGNAESVAVCFNGEKNLFDVPAVEYGEENDGLSLASNLFYVLRKVDDLGFSRAFVRCPEPVGLGLAVYNRLLRSAAFHVVDVDRKLPVIGLTGPSGAGKSTVAKYFEEKGFYIIDGDVLAREAVKNKEVLTNLAKEFGDDIINEDGTLNRRLTADRAFATPEKTQALNAITHPTIMALTYIEITRAGQSDAKGVVIDAAALLQSPIINMCDMLVCVIAPKEERAQRIIRRDGITPEQAMTRLNAQKDESYYIENTDYTISNACGVDFHGKADEIIAEALK